VNRTLFVYPWDIAEEGAATVAARAREAGLDGLAVATSYHAGKFLRPHAPVHKTYFTDDGSVYFRHDPRRYGRIKPVENAAPELLGTIMALNREAPDLGLVSWTVGLHNSRLGTMYPELVARTAFGDALCNSLCPSQPAVRDYLVSLVSDIGANLPVREIMLETPGWQAYRHGHHHEFELIEFTPAAQALMSVCFCDACQGRAARAGIDAGALGRQVRGALEAFFEDGTPPFDPLTDAAWRPFLAWRAGVVTSLVAEIRAALILAVKLAVLPSVQSPNALCWIEGSDTAGLAKAADRLEIAAYRQGPKAIAEEISAVQAAAGAGATIGYIVRPTFPDLRNGAEVREAVAAVQAAGAVSVGFYNYGHMRLESLDWIRAAF
jgi:hypothetical protein